MKQITGSLALWLIVATSAGGSSYAGAAAAAPQWNVMVIPSGETVYSGQARIIFDQQCARCHSQDGRAQTPTGRKHHVGDLSESRLADDIIIEQILEGTHNKANTFKMPPFKTKLSRAEVESLVPLVKAFRPVSPVNENHVAANPRLVGLINFSYDQYAVLEAAGSSNRYFILQENESHEGIKLLRLMPKNGMVKLEVGGTKPDVTLMLDGWAPSHPRRSGLSGFLERLSNALSAAPQRIVLSKANTELVLFLLSQFSGRTLIRSPRLPASTFDPDIGAAGPNDIAQRLKKALRAKGISTIEDGHKFLLVVPTSEVSAIKPCSSGIKSLAGDNDRQGLFPGGVFVNFPNTDLSQVVKFYEDLTGRVLDPAQHLPPSQGTVNFTTQTALSPEECAYALETLLNWHGLKVVPAGSDASKFDPLSGSSQ